VIILDINIPYVNGIEVASTIRAIDKKTQILIFTAMANKENLLTAIELQLTTFIEKPVSQAQLLLALNKISSNTNININSNNNVKYFWNQAWEELTCDNKIISLSKNEKNLLSLLITKKNTVVSYEEIHEEIWFNQLTSFNLPSIKTLVQGLRKKLPKNTIRNIYGIGFLIKIDL